MTSLSGGGSEFGPDSLESTPPDKYEPTGTSAFSRVSTDRSMTCSNSSTRRRGSCSAAVRPGFARLAGLRVRCSRSLPRHARLLRRDRRCVARAVRAAFARSPGHGCLRPTARRSAGRSRGPAGEVAAQLNTGRQASASLVDGRGPKPTTAGEGPTPAMAIPTRTGPTAGMRKNVSPAPKSRIPTATVRASPRPGRRRPRRGRPG